ncbi:hypothetical protein B9Z55_022780 [Caenorhabditis nigoni]|uniref:Uncharacterized protein n=1 Tax=Caenorhabditis nigoni TaxID=1611254 RepID=A0A2G5SLX7_9PELO|nr:hypothetical protein B9Z55_022780 [Caenorhabditis nigoni]
MKPEDEEANETILFQCLMPKTISRQGLEATDFHRQRKTSVFCHIRFTRPMLQGDDVEIKVVFHDHPKVEGQILLSITPDALRFYKAKNIIKKNPFVIDPAHAWISNLANDDETRKLRFGLRYKDDSIQLRLPDDDEFFTFFHIPPGEDFIIIDIFFCENVKSVCLRDPKSRRSLEEGSPLLYEKKSQVMIV